MSAIKWTGQDLKLSGNVLVSSFKLRWASVLWPKSPRKMLPGPQNVGGVDLRHQTVFDAEKKRYLDTFFSSQFFSICPL
jgi:hypothetical protein